MNLPEKVRRKLKDLPDEPGCYLMRDRRGRIIYVGKAASLRKRVQSYFREASLRRGSPKLRGLVRSIEDFDLITVRTEAEAMLLEGQLIKDYRPRYNVSFRDDKRFLLLRVDVRQPFPVFKPWRLIRDDGAEYFGPYVSSGAARAALDFIEKRYGLRKCTPLVPDVETHRHCLNDILRYCSAPCIGKVTAEEYATRVKEACAFLNGERPAVLRELRDSMQTAAAALDFEKAGALRDTLLFLQAVVRHRKPRVAAHPGTAGIGTAELARVLGLAAPPRVIEAFDISNISGTYAVASMVCAVDGVPRSNRYRRFRIRTVEGSDDPAMMAEVVRRRYSRLLEEKAELPDLVLVDGGITQLRAAGAVLAELGLQAVPLAGLAKRFEEIHRPGDDVPVRLPRDSAALQVLQRLRDEAHRFALTYHRTLRNRRIRESVLDDIPGVGTNRKRALLQHFGSIRKLAQATADEIAAVPGIGAGMASDILKALRGQDGIEGGESVTG